MVAHRTSPSCDARPRSGPPAGVHLRGVVEQVGDGPARGASGTPRTSGGFSVERRTLSTASRGRARATASATSTSSRTLLAQRAAGSSPRARLDEVGDERGRAPRAWATQVGGARALLRSVERSPLGEQLDVGAQVRERACAARGRRPPRADVGRRGSESSASSIVLKLAPRRAQLVGAPQGGIRRDEVTGSRPTCWAASVSCAHGRERRGAPTAQPSSAASPTPASADEHEEPMRRRPSTSSTSSSGRATWTRRSPGHLRREHADVRRRRSSASVERARLLVGRRSRSTSLVDREPAARAARRGQRPRRSGARPGRSAIGPARPRRWPWGRRDVRRPGTGRGEQHAAATAKRLTLAWVSARPPRRAAAPRTIDEGDRGDGSSVDRRDRDRPPPSASRGRRSSQAAHRSRST